MCQRQPGAVLTCAAPEATGGAHVGPRPTSPACRDKVAVVTGSTSGIGLAMARGFACRGANIVINGLGDAMAIKAERAGIEAEFGVGCAYSPANMLSGAEIGGMVKLAADRFGGCDILVNNAGIQHVAPIDEFPTEKWEAIIAINLSAAFHCHPGCAAAA